MNKLNDPIAATGLGIVSFVNGILIRHPCTVLRRQCQVHQFAGKKHLTPFTLVPVVFNVISKDGIMSLWKGSIGCGVLWAISQVTEMVIADVFHLPKSYVLDGSKERFWRHVGLKASTYFATTPFIVSSFVETVRSGASLADDDTRILDVVYQGVDRVRFDFISSAVDSSKRFPILHLIVPNVGYYTVHFVVSKYTYETVHGIAKRYVTRKLPSERTRFHVIMPEIFSTMTSALVADLVCYPLETVLHRLFIQGTRTLIDNLDNGVSAISIASRYTGFFDCLRSIVDREGFWALYSGVGTVALQYMLQFCVLRLVRMAFDHVSGEGGVPPNFPHPLRKSPNNGGAFMDAPFGGALQHQPEFSAVPTTSSSLAFSPQDPSSMVFPSFAQTQRTLSGAGGTTSAPSSAVPFIGNFQDNPMRYGPFGPPITVTSTGATIRKTEPDT